MINIYFVPSFNNNIVTDK